jgi:hypothetical protein
MLKTWHQIWPAAAMSMTLLAALIALKWWYRK